MSWLGIGTDTHVILSMLKLCPPWTYLGLVHTATALCIHMCISPVVSEEHCSLVVLHSILLLQPFFLLFLIWGFRGGVWWRYQFRTEFSHVSQSLHIIELWVSVLVPIYSKFCCPHKSFFHSAIIILFIKGWVSVYFQIHGILNTDGIHSSSVSHSVILTILDESVR